MYDLRAPKYLLANTGATMSEYSASLNCERQGSDSVCYAIRRRSRTIRGVNAVHAWQGSNEPKCTMRSRNEAVNIAISRLILVSAV